jgi:hypothetical protein
VVVEHQGCQPRKSDLFAIELTGCLGPEAQRPCTQLADLTGEGPEGRKRVNELISIGLLLSLSAKLKISSAKWESVPWLGLSKDNPAFVLNLRHFH